jgi:hypothetical protein
MSTAALVAVRFAMWPRAFSDLELIALMSFTIWVVIGTAAMLRWIDRSGRLEAGFASAGALTGVGLLCFVSWVAVPASAFVRGPAIFFPLTVAFYLAFGWVEQGYEGNPVGPFAIMVGVWSVGFVGALGASLLFGFQVNLLPWPPVILVSAALGAFTRRALRERA